MAQFAPVSSSQLLELQVRIFKIKFYPLSEFLFLTEKLGAGKTTLLNFLSGREISMNLEKTGKILVNGVEKETLPNFSAYSAYVQQDDILFQTMTVRECLEFAARLKLPGTEE